MSSIVRTAQTGVEPVSLSDMKTTLGIPAGVTAYDTRITRLIKAARIEAEKITNCALVRSTFAQYFDHFPGWHSSQRGYFGANFHGIGPDHQHHHHGEMKIKRPPLVSVQSLIYIGNDGKPATLKPGVDFVVDCASQPGRIRPIPYTAWPLALHVPNAVSIAFTAGYSPNAEGVTAGQNQIAEPEVISEDLPVNWKPSTVYPQYSFVVDSLGNIQVQITAGTPTSGSTKPVFPGLHATVTDGGVTWQNFGPLTGFWTPDSPFSVNGVIEDSNGNLQLAIASVTSALTAPIWATALGGATADNGIVAWRCLGPYQALGNNPTVTPSAIEQQAAYVIDWTLPETVTLAIEQLVALWYFHPEPISAETARAIPENFEALLAGVTVEDYAPTL